MLVFLPEGNRATPYWVKCGDVIDQDHIQPWKPNVYTLLTLSIHDLQGILDEGLVGYKKSWGKRMLVDTIMARWDDIVEKHSRVYRRRFEDDTQPSSSSTGQKQEDEKDEKKIKTVQAVEEEDSEVEEPIYGTPSNLGSVSEAEYPTTLEKKELIKIFRDGCVFFEGKYNMYETASGTIADLVGFFRYDTSENISRDFVLKNVNGIRLAPNDTLYDAVPDDAVPPYIFYLHPKGLVGGGKRGGGGTGGYAKKTREQELKDFKEQISTMVMRISMSPKAVIINNIKDEALGLAKVMETNKSKAITTVLEKLDVEKLKRLSSDVVSCSPRASDRAKMMANIIYTELMAEIDELQLQCSTCVQLLHAVGHYCLLAEFGDGSGNISWANFTKAITDQIVALHTTPSDEDDANGLADLRISS